MRELRSVVAALVLSSTVVPLHAEVARADRTAEAAVAPMSFCPCEHYSFVPLSDKARAVAAYWTARRVHRNMGNTAMAVALLAFLSQNGGAVNAVQEALSKASSELAAARAKAVGLGGIKTADDDRTVQIFLRRGVDYSFAD